MDTNSENLVSPDAPWRQTEKRYDAAFPQQNNLDPGRDRRRHGRTGRCAPPPNLPPRSGRTENSFPMCAGPMAGPSSPMTGCCCCRCRDVRATMQPADPGAALPRRAGGGSQPARRHDDAGHHIDGRDGRSDHARLARQADRRLQCHARKDRSPASRPGSAGARCWAASAPSDVSPTRRFIEVKPVLDYDALMPGERATAAIRKAAREGLA